MREKIPNYVERWLRMSIPLPEASEFEIKFMTMSELQAYAEKLIECNNPSTVIRQLEVIRNVISNRYHQTQIELSEMTHVVLQINDKLKNAYDMKRKMDTEKLGRME